MRQHTKDGTLLWTRDLGSSVNAIATSVSEDGAGNVIVVGSILGATPGDPWAGDNDAFVRIYAGDGTPLLPGEDSAGDMDAFLRMYASDGTLRWTRQFASAGADVAHAVSVDADGNVLVAGTRSAF
ncbi:MAG: hypothetical protein IPN77_04725 [Sandaracinaceae bacterium]|nr:hypothetical protein [Sandaracinaceae bacterium]